MSVNFHTGSGIKVSLSTGITHESPGATIGPVPHVGRCKSKEPTETIYYCIRVVRITILRLIIAGVITTLKKS